MKYKKEKKFERIVKWDDSDFKKGDFWTISVLVLPFIILFYILFGWLVGIIWWVKNIQRNLEKYQEIYWIEKQEEEK